MHLYLKTSLKGSEMDIAASLHYKEVKQTLKNPNEISVYQEKHLVLKKKDFRAQSCKT